LQQKAFPSGEAFLSSSLMKKWFTFLLFLTTLHLLSQELVPVFGPFLPVTAPFSSTGSTRPRIALVRDTIPLVTWTKIGSGNGIVYASRWNPAFSSFDTAVQISPAGMDVYSSTGEGGDIAARGDTAFIVFFTTDSRCFCVRSVDGGMTWGDTVRIDHSLNGDMAYTPDVQILPGGNPVVVFEGADMNMQNTRQLVCRSNDGGQTFSGEMDAHLGITGAPCECCPPALLVSDSAVYVLYRNNDNNVRNIVMTISSDSGMTFPVTSGFDQTNWTINSCPTAGADATFWTDSIVAVWKSANKIYYSTAHSIDGGAGSSHLLEPSLSSGVLQRYPAICGSGDTLVYTWDDRRSGNYDVYVAISGSGPQDFSTVFIINDTVAAAENGVQQCPHAAYANGKIHMVYQVLSSGQVMYRYATVGSGVGIDSPHEESGISIFPNPVADELVVRMPEGKTGCTAKIYSMSGELIVVQVMNQNVTHINCSGFTSGNYILEVEDAENVIFTTNFIRK